MGIENLLAVGTENLLDTQFPVSYISSAGQRRPEDVTFTEPVPHYRLHFPVRRGDVKTA
jgi:hypothetical protein